MQAFVGDFFVHATPSGVLSLWDPVRGRAPLRRRPWPLVETHRPVARPVLRPRRPRGDSRGASISRETCPLSWPASPRSAAPKGCVVAGRRPNQWTATDRSSLTRSRSLLSPTPSPDAPQKRKRKRETERLALVAGTVRGGVVLLDLLDGRVQPLKSDGGAHGGPVGSLVLDEDGAHAWSASELEGQVLEWPLPGAGSTQSRLKAFSRGGVQQLARARLHGSEDVLFAARCVSCSPILARYSACTSLSMRGPGEQPFLCVFCLLSLSLVRHPGRTFAA